MAGAAAETYQRVVRADCQRAVILAAGGGLSGVLRDSGAAEATVRLALGAHMPALVLAWLLRRWCGLQWDRRRWRWRWLQGCWRQWPAIWVCGRSCCAGHRDGRWFFLTSRCGFGWFSRFSRWKSRKRWHVDSNGDGAVGGRVGNDAAAGGGAAVGASE